MTDRQLPHHDDIERLVLASCILSPDEAMPIVTEALRADDWYREPHRKLWGALVWLHDHRKPIDFRIVIERLDATGDLPSIGGARGMGEFLDGIPRISNLSQYCSMVADAARRRETIREAARLMESAYDESEPLEVSVEHAQASMSALCATNAAGHDVPLAAALKSASERLERYQKVSMVGIPTPWPSLNGITRGLNGGQLVIVAGRVGCGKSSALLQMADCATDNGAWARHFPLEMSPTESTMRLMCARIGANKYHMREADWTRSANDYGKLMAKHWVWDDRSSPTAAEVVSACHRQKRTKGLDVVIVDHLQRMSYPERDAVPGLAACCKALKSMAKDLDVVVLLGSQFNREAEKRGGTPRLSDLKGSGAAEEEADIVLGLHPDKEVEASAPYLPTWMEILKHRDGASGGRILLSFERRHTRFVEQSEQEAEAREKTWQGRLESAK